MADAVLVHCVPGRVRLRVQGRHDDFAAFSAFSEQFSSLDCVERLNANPSTRSIVIEFSGTLENLTERLKEHGLFVEQGQKLKDERPRHGSKSPEISPFNLVTGHDIDAMFMIGSLLAAVAVAQAFRGKILVSAIPASWYAMEAFRQSQRRPNSGHL